MSILIKGMEMPKRCEDCPCVCEVDTVYQTACGCKLTMKIREIDNNTRPHWCPLVPVQPHGRTIDADEFLQRALGTRCFHGDYARMLEELVGESKTIIPAEGQP